MSDSQYPSESIPVLSLDLHGYPDPILNLGIESVLGDPKLLIIKTHERSSPVMLLLDGLEGDGWGFDIVTALQHSLLQLLDAQTEDVIPVPPRDSLARCRTINPIAIEEVHSVSFHSRHDFWRHLVRNGQTYLIRFSESGGLAGASRTRRKSIQVTWLDINPTPSPCNEDQNASDPASEMILRLQPSPRLYQPPQTSAIFPQAFQLLN
ncbi:MAG: hypothetical protein M1830_009785 [Pleopsidium flavum]|nr:MAG: hypothetical protein M1830_009785 [Pleopsidium flavum]